MLFDMDSVSVKLLDVLYWQDEQTEAKNTYRRFHALSLRLQSDAQFEHNGQVLQMHDRDLIFAPKGCSYVRRCGVDKMIVFHFLTDIPSADSQIFVFQNTDFDALYPLFRRALNEWTEKKPGYYYRATALLYRILGELTRRSEPNTSAMHSIVIRAVGIMKRGVPDCGCSVGKIALQLNVSEAYLRRMFQQELGCSPKQYLIALRMQRARDLLNARYDSVSVISEKVGFSDPKNFATAYKKYYGYPPSMQSYQLTDF